MGVGYEPQTLIPSPTRRMKPNHHILKIHRKFINYILLSKFETIPDY